jgi:3D (Asp-Asp-Asp) domain-containing protein
LRALAQLLLGALLVTASAYTPCPTEGGPMAADGCRVVPGRSLAVSRDLRHLLGRWLHIEGVGWRLAHDLMGARARMAVDVAVRDRNSAREFGRQRVTVRLK